MSEIKPLPAEDENDIDFLRREIDALYARTKGYSQRATEWNKRGHAILDRLAADRAERLVLPPHKASCHITHNQHLAYYLTVREMFADGHDGLVEDFVSDDERERAFASNEVWSIQWYPDTPVGSCTLHASSLEALNLHIEAMDGDGS